MEHTKAVDVKDQLVALLGMATLLSLAWSYEIHLAKSMGPMPVSMPGMQMWTASGIVALWTMWAVMMVAMMLPSAAPTILIFMAMERNRKQPSLSGRAGLFLAGYLIAWAAFCVFATAGQWALHSVALLSPMMVSTSARLSGLIFMLAGIFQWTPLKNRCLSHCRSPLGFLLAEWRDGAAGSAVMGFRHGTYCVACCWLLMALLFAVGVMNLVWVAFLSAFVLVERVLPFGDRVGKVGGALLFIWGAWLFF